MIRPIEDRAVSLFDELLSARSYVVSFVNAHAVNLACKNVEFFTALTHADLLLRDGIGAKILMRALGRNPGFNMNGTDFIPRMLLASKSKAIALYGSSAKVAALAAACLQRDGVATVTHCDGYQPIAHYVERVKVEQPRVVILGMGMPKQEFLAQVIMKECSNPVLIINGGAILDFMAGRFKRAPLPLRRFGMEWLFRLWLEPARLWRRYMLGNLAFLIRASLAGLCYRFGDRQINDKRL